MRTVTLKRESAEAPSAFVMRLANLIGNFKNETAKSLLGARANPHLFNKREGKKVARLSQRAIFGLDR